MFPLARALSRTPSPQQPQPRRQRLRRWFCALRVLPLLWLLALPATAQTEDYTYTTNNDAITITGYSGPGGVVTIPGTISGLLVTAIGDHAFAWRQGLASVTIPDSVISIETYAFYNCNFLTNVAFGNSVTSIGSDAFDACQGLTRVTIPDNVLSIENSAFFDCTSLTSVWIGKNVTNIGGGAFADCTSLSAIAVNPNNLAYSSVEGVLCDKSQTTLVQCPAGKAGSYTIPNAVTTIGSAAFEYCTSLTSVWIGNNVASIGGGAFWACTSLTSVLVPASVTNVGNGAFFGCTNLSGVYFSGNAPSGGWNAFVGANHATVYYLPGATGWGLTFGSLPTALWLPQVQTSDNRFGVRTNQFGFNITWASGMVVVVEACTNLGNPIWSPVGTNTFTTGAFYFSDPDWTNCTARFYRLRSP
jgi:hypothetical protein